MLDVVTFIMALFALVLAAANAEANKLNSKSIRDIARYLQFQLKKDGN